MTAVAATPAVPSREYELMAAAGLSGAESLAPLTTYQPSLRTIRTFERDPNGTVFSSRSASR